MGSSEILSNWIGVGERMYQRTKLYGPTWSEEILEEGVEHADIVDPAPFGGPVLVVRKSVNTVQIHRASGPEISHFRWRNAPIVATGWSHKEEPVFVGEDGTVLICSLFGEFLDSPSMGQEAKDVGVRDARVFRSASAAGAATNYDANDVSDANSDAAAVTGVVVLTKSNRFFLVNNIYQPRVRKLHDLPNTFFTGRHLFPWSVLAPTAGAARVIIGMGGAGGSSAATATAAGGGGGSSSAAAASGYNSASCVTILSHSEASDPDIEPLTSFDKGQVVEMAVALNGEHVALYFDSGLLWMGTVSALGTDKSSSSKRLCHMNLSDDESMGFKPTKFFWCGTDSVLCVSPSTNQCLIASLDGSRSMDYLPGYMATVQEIDGARLMTTYAQEWLQCIPPALHQTCASASNSPGKNLLKAAEKFDKGSHKANEYIRSLGSGPLAIGIAECIEAAGLLIDPVHQKELARAAQFGKAFAQTTGNAGNAAGKRNADDFSNVCKNLRVLNALRLYQVGIPLTMAQFYHLSPRVVIDRLLARRLYPLAQEICGWLALPPKVGSNRVLAHWARYKVGKASGHAGVMGGGGDNDSAQQVASAIHAKLGNNPQIPYCDIAAKALEYGKEDLAIKLLDYETSVNRQVPLLVTLGRESKALALTRALKSGNRNLAYFVIWELRKTLPSTDFHMLIRKYELGKVLYESYCQTNEDAEALQEWHLQEDNYMSQAVSSFQQAVAASNPDTRMAKLINVHELFERAAKQQSNAPPGGGGGSGGVGVSGGGTAALAAASAEACAQLTDEQHKLLKRQSELESKIPGSIFVGMSLHQTLSNLLQSDENKWAEKVRSEFKVSDRRFQWLKLKKFAVNGQFEEIHKFCVKQRKKPLIALASIIVLVRQHAGGGSGNEAADEITKPFEDMLLEDESKRSDFPFM